MTDYLDTAVAEVFEFVMGVRCSHIQDSDLTFTENIAVSIRFTGLTEGSCCLSLSDSAATTLAQKLLANLSPPSREIIWDAAGELCNMIVGSWKSKLPPEQACALISLPLRLEPHGGGPTRSHKRLYSFEGNLFQLTFRFD